MTDKDLTFITIVLDRSGSMQAIKGDTEGGFNAFIEDQKSQPGKRLVSLHQFNTSHEKTYSARPIEEVPALSLQPSGGTALLDAVAKAINDTQAEIDRLPLAMRPASVILAILTDGHENSSREFNQAQVKSMIKHQQDSHSWLFQFFGADITTMEMASNIGIAPAQTLHFNTVNTREVFTTASASGARYAGATQSGLSYSEAVVASTFTADERDAATKPKSKTE